MAPCSPDSTLSFTERQPWNNGRQESFFSSFKFEFGKTHYYPTIEKLIEAIGRHINYYNTERIHSALKMPPQKFFLKQKGA
jgi:transposase InsO family protein